MRWDQHVSALHHTNQHSHTVLTAHLEVISPGQSVQNAELDLLAVHHLLLGLHLITINISMITIEGQTPLSMISTSSQHVPYISSSPLNGGYTYSFSDPVAALCIGDVHVLHTDGVRIRLAKTIVDLAQRCLVPVYQQGTHSTPSREGHQINGELWPQHVRHVCPQPRMHTLTTSRGRAAHTLVQKSLRVDDSGEVEFSVEVSLCEPVVTELQLL